MSHFVLKTKRDKTLFRSILFLRVCILSVFFSGYSGDTIFHNSSCFYCFSVSRFGSYGGRFSVGTPSATCWSICFDWLVHYFWLNGR